MDIAGICSIGGFFIGYVVSPILKTSKKLKKFWIFLLNKQVMWSITARFEREDDEDFEYSVFENVKRYFVENYTQMLGSRRCTLDKDIPNNTFIYNCSGLTFQVNCSGRIFIQMREYHAPYRDSRKLISKKIIPLLTDLEELVKANTSNSKLEIGYSCKIKFENKNPFMGQYLLKDTDLDLKTFNCVLEGKNSKTIVEIHKNEFEFQSNNLSLLQSLMDEHLSVGG